MVGGDLNSEHKFEQKVNKFSILRKHIDDVITTLLSSLSNTIPLIDARSVIQMTTDSPLCTSMASFDAVARASLTMSE